MSSFTENFTLIEGLTISFAFVATVISIATIFITKRDLKKQLRLPKLEESLEIVLLIQDNYSALMQIFELQQKIRNPEIVRTVIDTMSWQEDYRKSVQTFRTIIDFNDFRQKLTRLGVLANSYLPNDSEVKPKILLLIDLTINLCLATIVDSYEEAIENYKKFPEPDNFFDFIEEIEMLIIEEMKLGYESLKMNEVLKYKDEFKKQLSID